MSVFRVSKPTPLQVIHGLERAITVGVVAFFGVWGASNYALNKVTLTAAGLAALTAIWQMFLSTLTTL